MRTGVGRSIEGLFEQVKALMSDDRVHLSAMRLLLVTATAVKVRIAAPRENN